VTATKQAPDRRRSYWLLDLYRSQIGRKWAMALSGVILLGYIVAHLVGNLKVYLGPEEINAYGESLRELGGHLAPKTHLLWLMRIGLTIAFAIHVHAAFSLAVENRRKGGEVGYQTPRDYLVASYASRTMIWSGIIVLAFIAYHLADLTWGWANPDFIRGDIYHNMVESFSRAPVAAIYIFANVALGFHIYHGAWSLFQSVGANNPRFNQWRRWFAQAFAVTIVAGNVLFPIMVLVGVIE
jgi:succinate dehydrogenase / fumarate reductase cytochrome b subunit